MTPERPILIDKFLENAIEAEADAISDGVHAVVPAVMEHIELAGIHSGDSACVIPPVSIPPKHVETISDYTRRIAIELGVVGLMNIQYAIAKDVVYVLEANPRASRTVPLVSKVCGINMVRLATQVMLGRRLSELGAASHSVPHYGVKEAVFPFNMFQEVDPVLGPEMRSTGEVLGLADSFGLAFYKAQEAAQAELPNQGTVLLSVNDADKPGIVEVARRFRELGFSLLTTRGTRDFLAKHGYESEAINKIHEGSPNIADAIAAGRDPAGGQHARRSLGQGGRLLHPQDGHQAQGAVCHDAFGRPEQCRRHRRPSVGPGRAQVSPGVPRARSLSRACAGSRARVKQTGCRRCLRGPDSLAYRAALAGGAICRARLDLADCFGVFGPGAGNASLAEVRRLAHGNPGVRRPALSELSDLHRSHGTKLRRAGSFLLRQLHRATRRAAARDASTVYMHPPLYPLLGAVAIHFAALDWPVDGPCSLQWMSLLLSLDVRDCWAYARSSASRRIRLRSGWAQRSWHFGPPPSCNLSGFTTTSS